MNYAEHKKRHQLLHRHLDELLGDWIAQTGNKILSEATVIEFLKWSYEQSLNPTECGQQQEDVHIDFTPVGYLSLTGYFTLEKHDKADMPVFTEDQLNARCMQHYELGKQQQELSNLNKEEVFRSIVERASKLGGLYYNTKLDPKGFELCILNLADDAKKCL